MNPDHNPDHDSIVLKMDQLERLLTSMLGAVDASAYYTAVLLSQDALKVLAELRKLVVK